MQRRKLIRSAALATFGAAAAYLYEWAMGMPFGWAPTVAAGASFAANLARLLLTSSR